MTYGVALAIHPHFISRSVNHNNKAHAPDWQLSYSYILAVADRHPSTIAMLCEYLPQLRGLRSHANIEHRPWHLFAGVFICLCSDYDDSVCVCVWCCCFHTDRSSLLAISAFDLNLVDFCEKHCHPSTGSGLEFAERCPSSQRALAYNNKPYIINKPYMQADNGQRLERSKHMQSADTIAHRNPVGGQTC